MDLKSTDTPAHDAEEGRKSEGDAGEGCGAFEICFQRACSKQKCPRCCRSTLDEDGPQSVSAGCSWMKRFPPRQQQQLSPVSVEDFDGFDRYHHDEERSHRSGDSGSSCTSSERTPEGKSSLFRTDFDFSFPSAELFVLDDDDAAAASRSKSRGRRSTRGKERGDNTAVENPTTVPNGATQDQQLFGEVILRTKKGWDEQERLVTFDLSFDLFQALSHDRRVVGCHDTKEEHSGGRHFSDLDSLSYSTSSEIDLSYSMSSDADFPYAGGIVLEDEIDW